jgi:hypothetical protein
VEKRGVIRVREEFTVTLPWHRYIAEWQLNPDGPRPFQREKGPGWNDVDEAVSWGRQRAPLVYVRLGEGWPDWYSAGERTGRHAPKRWPGAPRRRAGNRHRDYAGVVWIGEESPVLLPSGTWSALWLEDTGAGIENRDDFADAEAAIDWARERAPVVLVAEVPHGAGWRHGRPTYAIRSAGELDPPGDPLPRIRPRRGSTTMTWEACEQRASERLKPETYRRRLEDALDRDGDISSPACRLSDAEPRMWSRPAILTSDPAPRRADRLAPNKRPSGWVDVAFHVSASSRPEALRLAVQALHRAHAATGEELQAGIGNLTVRALD